MRHKKTGSVIRIGSLVLAMVSWAVFIYLMFVAKGLERIGNAGHKPTDVNGLVGVMGLFMELVSGAILILAIIFTLVFIFSPRKQPEPPADEEDGPDMPAGPA